jgi:hypothetical protein
VIFHTIAVFNDQKKIISQQEAGSLPLLNPGKLKSNPAAADIIRMKKYPFIYPHLPIIIFS